MNRTLPLLLAALVALSACGDDTDRAAGDVGTPPSSTEEDAREAMDAIGDAVRRTGEAARSAAEDAADALGPALERAGEVGRDALDATREGVNDATRSAACQTSRAAEDAEGIAANC